MTDVISFPTSQSQSTVYTKAGLSFTIVLPERDASAEDANGAPVLIYGLVLGNGDVVYSTAEGVVALIEASVAGQQLAERAAAEAFLHKIAQKWALVQKHKDGYPKKSWWVWEQS
ncbi:hypothetical protein GQ56_0104320 [Burkholderia paludis]|uniref:hypothetical protein n=1 Tax=Burkholderia paludis TaxID=1506587 RepID=UPI0004DB8978|nr:hypothetical protein [Burkholderia paludis]KFG98290.1 hypothetical protein GQ56_0104320 [Burkholderia paludis]